jgi:hypothetical protein
VDLLLIFGGRMGPFRVAEVGERKVCLGFGHRVGIDAQRQRGIRVPELIGYPAGVLPGLECHRRPSVARVVESERPDAELLAPATNPLLDSLDVSRVQGGSGARAENPLGHFAPAASQYLLPALGQQIK